MSEKMSHLTPSSGPEQPPGWHVYDGLVAKSKEEERERKNRAKRWADPELEQGGTIKLGPRQLQDVLLLMGKTEIPPYGDYLLHDGAKFSVGRDGRTCVIYGYQRDGSDVAKIVKDIRNGTRIAD